VGFSWPFALLALLALPVLAWWYSKNLERPSEAVVMHPDLELLLRASASGGSSWRRVLPAVLYLAALALGVVALARPTAPLPVPDNKTTIMLSIDVSLSMNADDIAPNRFRAAQEAAKIFVKQLPKGTKIGLVSFAGYSLLNQTPTTDFDAVIRAIDDLDLGRGTAIGAGILEALRALPGRGVNDDPKAANLPPAAIVLLTDGRSNRPPPPVDAAEAAKASQVKVYTVGLGTENGFLAPNEMGIGGFTVGFDSETLKEIARITGGQYFEARSAGQLSSIYKGLGRSIGWTTKPGEVTGVAAVLASLVLFASLVAGQVSRRVI
jgi:Ca-activated chloride channel homolog